MKASVAVAAVLATTVVASASHVTFTGAMQGISGDAANASGPAPAVGPFISLLPISVGFGGGSTTPDGMTFWAADLTTVLDPDLGIFAIGAALGTTGGALGTYHADSFFDIFFEVDLHGQRFSWSGGIPLLSTHGVGTSADADIELIGPGGVIPLGASGVLPPGSYEIHGFAHAEGVGAVGDSHAVYGGLLRFVPLPGTGALAGAGLIGLGAIRRRR